MSSTIRWVVRVLGILMALAFGYVLCSMQEQLVNLQRTKRQREALEGRPRTPPARGDRKTPPATPTPAER